MRPYVERLIRNAKGKDYQGNLTLKKFLFTSSAIKHVKDQLVPRFE
jgi:ribosomal protein L17